MICQADPDEHVPGRSQPAIKVFQLSAVFAGGPGRAKDSRQKIV
jgi:hypothetical protein